MPLDLETRDQLITSVRRFVSERLVPIEDKVARDDLVPDDVVAEMRELGLFGISIPTEYGGLGLTMEEEVLVCFELGKTSPAFRSVIGTNVGIGSQGVVMFGRDDQKKEWLPKLASGEAIASFCLTEPGAGSDAASVRTSAVRKGNEYYVVNGTKRFITNANKASVFTLMARTDPANKGAGGISAFFVPSNLKGITVGKPERKMGQQGAHICDVVFEDCHVPADCLLGQEGQGFRVAMQVLDRGRIHIGAVCVGVAERLIRDAAKYAMEREQFGQKIAEFQLIQAMLADSQTEMYAARCMILDAAKKRDAGENVTMEAACAKYFASEMVGRVADRAVQIHGGAGYVTDYGVERFYRDVRIFRIYEGTSQVQQLVIARNLLRSLS
ncbi:MAG: acyl-CoA dehydrogenase family protein [Alphaproteobacteria bacterium]|nr:acyl-CoA dehydrogenase family protein [Alphaproteobacteria bacterium]